MIRKMGWKKMSADVADRVLQTWAPSGSEDPIADIENIRESVQTQRWRGLHIRDFEGKSKGIITTRIFQAGEVLCD